MIGTKDFGANLSEEKMEFLDTDALLWFAPPADEKKIKSGKVYQALGVNKEGRAIYIRPGDAIENPFSFITVLSLPYLTKNLTPLLANAIDGDPATSTDPS